MWFHLERCDHSSSSIFADACSNGEHNKSVPAVILQNVGESFPHLVVRRTDSVVFCWKFWGRRNEFYEHATTWTLRSPDWIFVTQCKCPAPSPLPSCQPTVGTWFALTWRWHWMSYLWRRMVTQRCSLLCDALQDGVGYQAILQKSWAFVCAFCALGCPQRVRWGGGLSSLSSIQVGGGGIAPTVPYGLAALLLVVLSSSKTDTGVSFSPAIAFFCMQAVQGMFVLLLDL